MMDSRKRVARCGSLYANAGQMGFVRDMDDGKVPVEDGPAKDEYAEELQKTHYQSFMIIE